MSETHDILQGTISELEDRETALVEEIERLQGLVKAELKDVRKALGSLRKQLNGAVPATEEPAVVTNETKDAVMRELEGKNGSGARAAGIASAASLNQNAVRAALEQLAESGDVETYGKGLWRIAA